MITVQIDLSPAARDLVAALIEAFARVADRLAAAPAGPDPTAPTPPDPAPEEPAEVFSAIKAQALFSGGPPEPPPDPLPASRWRRAEWATGARRETLRALYAAGAPMARIAAELTALPGPPVPPSRRLCVYAIETLRVRRPSKAASPGQSDGAIAVVPAPSPSEPAPAQIDTPAAAVDAMPGPVASPPPAVPSTAAHPRWTAERSALLRRDFGRRDDTLLLEDLNSRPGAPVTLEWMRGYATGVLKMPAPPARPAGKSPAPVRASRALIEDYATRKGWPVRPYSLIDINRRLREIGAPQFIETDRMGREIAPA